MIKNKIVLSIGFCLLFIGTYIVPTLANDNFHSRHYSRVKVMTYNLYVGAAVLELLNIFDPEDPPSPADIVGAVTGLFLDVQDTNFPERAQAIADQIKRFRPHLIGLQEASLFLIQSPGDFAVGNPDSPGPDNPCEEAFDPNAPFVAFDYLDLLMNELDGKYVAVVVGCNADIELPMSGSVVGQSGLVDVRLIQRDVILVRKGIETSNPLFANYAARVPLPTPLPEILRGVGTINATVNGNTYRFVNTHLEVADLPGVGESAQQAQATELIGLLEALADEDPLPVILVGDFNSEQGSAVDTMLAANQYRDIFPIRWFGRRFPGDTCCQDPDLQNDISLLDQRIDYIRARNRVHDLPFTIVLSVFARVVGNKPEDRTLTGLWPSDHGGVIAKLIFPH